MNIVREKKGFTLLELLIVIAIIAALSTILVIVINPAETLAQSRDAQRLSDLSSLKSALSLYLSTVQSPQLDGIAGTRNDACIDGTFANRRIWLSVPTSATTVSDNTPPITIWQAASAAWQQPTTIGSSTPINGTGWIPVNFGALTGGSPISNLPLDPTNTVTTAGTVTNADYMYRYACKGTPISFEIDAALESIQYKTTDDKRAKDGGDNASLFEVGTDLSILPGTNDF
ncbi:MAG: prepilin-type N-terminal cleavage/methylation domain-containing protein [Candidatus Paceibacterota bacterium]|jgi:prepilin-type N-terminal cleavage/methylation domain-containing protein